VNAASSAVKRGWNWLKTNKEQLTIVFAVVAAIWAGSEYYNKQRADKHAETARYIDRYYGEAYLDARSALNVVLFERANQEALFEARKSSDTAEIEAFVSSTKLTEPILKLVELYDNLTRCVRAGLCSKEVACAYFKDDINALHNLFRPLFTKAWKEMWGEDFMASSIAFARTC
jgi:hypothetical protein